MVSLTCAQINGEKTNPLPMELSLKGSSPYIQEGALHPNPSHFVDLIGAQPLSSVPTARRLAA